MSESDVTDVNISNRISSITHQKLIMLLLQQINDRRSFIINYLNTAEHPDGRILS